MKSKSTFVMLFALLLWLALPAAIHADEECDFADEAIRMGGIVPLSAPGATIGGIAMDWGFDYAADEINAACGIEIEGRHYRIDVISGDSEGISERGQAIAERLILEDGVHVMIGVYHSAVGLATMGVMQEHRIPTIMSNPRNDNISAAGIVEYNGKPPRIASGADYIFRIAPSSSMVGIVVTDFLMAQGADNVALMIENTDYGQPAAAYEQARLEANGVAVTKYDIELGTEDFVPILSRIQAQADPPDAIRMVVTGETALNLTQQMAELGIAPSADTICITNQVAFQSEQFWAVAPDANYCGFDRIGTIPSLFNEVALALNEAYEAAWGDVVASHTMESYDSVYLMADAIQRAGTFTDPDAIVAALETTDMLLSQGRYYFEYGTHNPDLPEGTPKFMWRQWPDPVVTVMQYFEPGQSGLDAAVIWPPIYQTHGTSYIVPGTSP